MICNNIILCGFMACGKTSIGKALSLKTNLEFIDTDAYIEKNFNMKIKDIFSKYSQNYFRKLEHNALKNLSSSKGCVISIGGGTILYKENYKILKDMGKIIFLDCSFDTIKERLKHDKTRPLAKTDNLLGLFSTRLEIYKSLCDFKICADKNINEIVEEILRYISTN